MDTKSLLRMLVIVGDREVPAWHLEAVRLLAAGGMCRVSVARLSGGAGAERRLPDWFVRRIPSLMPVDVPPEWSDLSWDGDSPDVLLDLRPVGRSPAHTPVDRSVPRMRMISGDRRHGLGVLPFAEEVARGSPATYVCLWLERPDADSGILFQGRWRTAPDRFSRYVQSILEEVATWPAAVVPAMAVQQPWAAEVDRSSKDRVTRITDEPGIGRVLWAMLKALVRRSIADLFRHEQWTIGAARVPICDFLDATRPISIDWLQNDRRRGYLADPFGVAVAEECKLLVERFDYRSGRGEIARLSYDGARKWGTVESSLRLPEHLSYPFIVEDQGNLYVLPECCESNRAVLYSVTDDLQDWRQIAVLVDDFPVVDGTLFRWDGRWWLFATSKDDGPDSHLYAWYSEKLTGPWMPHTHNPIKIDVASARPAGTPFVHQGSLYRPAQDCSRTYGGSLVIQEVVRLGPREFQEHVVRRLSPEPGSRWSRGLHTLSCVGGAYTLVDAKREIFSPAAALCNLRNVTAKAAERVLHRFE